MSIVILGGGPAGLTAAHELLHRYGTDVVVLEQHDIVGGISRTVSHNGNRIDIGGHRFFSKSDRVMDWWMQRLPLERTADPELQITYQNASSTYRPDGVGVDPNTTDEVMLIRERRSRIYWNRKLFDYPLSMNLDTISNLGLAKTARAGGSYLWAMARPIADEETLEDFFINRFGRNLYETFFRSYTEKVWGVPCEEITAEWGAQRVKGLDLRAAVKHALTPARADVAQKSVETSLIERFLYPKFGPGQLWEKVTDEIREAGGEVLTGWRVVDLVNDHRKVTGVVAEEVTTGERKTFHADAVVSSLPLPVLIRSLAPHPPAEVRAIADELPFRDFFTVGLLVDRIELEPDPGLDLIDDNWIYIQEDDVRIGRLQVFNNWSPWLVQDPSKVWLGLEYFCQHTDDIWSWPDEDLIRLGEAELRKIGILASGQVRDGCVLRVRRTYPAYFGSYDRIDVVRRHLDQYENLWCVGRNGQHRYNNQDHSMLTAMMAAEAIAGLPVTRDEIWSVNTDDDYHETAD